MAFSLSRNEPIREWMLALRRDADIDTFLETGTRRGNGATWAAQNGFNPVYTIDVLDREPAGAFLEMIQNDVIFRHVGKSVDVLNRLIEWVDLSTIFWLDAHGPKDVGSPVLEELEIILARQEPSYIFIDDISIFARERFYVWKYKSWPWAKEIYKALGSRPHIERADVLISYPKNRADLMYKHCQLTREIKWFMDLFDPNRKKPAEGWYKPWRARKYHYMVKGRSVCGGYHWDIVVDPDRSLRVALSGRRCKRCLRRL